MCIVRTDVRRTDLQHLRSSGDRRLLLKLLPLAGPHKSWLTSSRKRQRAWRLQQSARGGRGLAQVLAGPARWFAYVGRTADV